MLQVREQEKPEVIRHLQRFALCVRYHQRSALLIEFYLAIGLDDLWAIAGSKAARQKAVGLSRQRVRDHGIGERKIRAGIKHVGVLIGGTAGLAEAIVGEGLLAAGDMRHQSFEHRAAGLVGIEAEIEIVLQITAALREAESD